MGIENWLFLSQNLARMRPNFTGQPINFQYNTYKKWIKQ